MIKVAISLEKKILQNIVRIVWSLCGRGIAPVRGFHKLTCPPLYRLALVLDFGFCVWKCTTSVATLDPNQMCSIGFENSASGIAQSLACTRTLEKMQKFRGITQL